MTHSRKQRGFTLVELAIASVILLVGIAAVMELVPRALRANLQNRMNTSSTVIAQRLMDLMTNAGVNAATLTDPTGTFPCGPINVCNLGVGGGAVGDFTAGAPLLAGGRINFAAAPAPGYRILYRDPNDASGIPYDVRWAVVSSVRNVGPQAAIVVSKRIIIGVQRQNGQDPVTLTSWVSR